MTVLGALFMTASFIPILFFMSCSQPPPLEPEKLRSSLSEKASKAHPWYPVYEHVKPPGVKLGCWWNTQFFFKRMVADLLGPAACEGGMRIPLGFEGLGFGGTPDSSSSAWWPTCLGPAACEGGLRIPLGFEGLGFGG
eukprot:CAMPEP_0202892340 /NCGR_PEP_ID=MMETSP1392-20130828/2060_1 /ASSEMBLY_ACC=CAM_ASM_000868 /TAXON_ID=225041 /ORGANISM="Chlamydomonas chlamydogama, Strain SAG 11-48b" /LENGTH=137 /DNA_ID=CAMNT_0049576237 /DNA_START=392 /DNA_END=802 /DNA_ORIENTATION=-